MIPLFLLHDICLFFSAQTNNLLAIMEGASILQPNAMDLLIVKTKVMKNTAKFLTTLLDMRIEFQSLGKILMEL